MLVYLLIVFIYFIVKVIKENDKFLWALIGASYFTGVEVFLRMTKANPFWETGKYAVIFFSLIGITFIGFKRNAIPYVIYFLLLVPGVLIAYDQLAYDLNFRKAVMFNLSGPICLSVACVFAYGRTIRLADLLKVLDYMVYPLITTTIFIILYQPSGRDIFVSASSNAAASGGFSGNQVATILGLGFFILLTRFFLPYKNVLVHWTMMFFMALMGYRALLTFSRGGVIAALVMGAVFISVYYFKISLKSKAKLTSKLVILSIGIVMLWGYSEAQTSGMITNRYTNKDSLGREKEDITTGRSTLAEAELDVFIHNPIFGLGVGRVSQYFEDELGIDLPTHNEIMRMLAEHGVFGILALLVLIFAPISSKIQGRRNIYFWSFLLFWFLTIGHSSMRVAAPAFIYALCLLNIDYTTENEPIKNRNMLGRKQQIHEYQQNGITRV